MRNPLDDPFEAYTTIKDALRVVRRLLDERNVKFLNGTSFWGLEKTEARELIEKTEDEFKGLIVLSLFAFFESQIRSHVKSRLQPLANGGPDSDSFAQELHQYVSKEAEWWRMDEVIELFSSSVAPNIKGDSKHIKNYRDYIAHRGKPAAPVPPAIAYERLTRFLEQAGLV